MKIIKLIKRSRLKKRPKKFLPVFDICLVKKSVKKKNVIEKIGTYNVEMGNLVLNVFRLIYWLGLGVSLSGNFLKLANVANIIKFKKLCNGGYKYY